MAIDNSKMHWENVYQNKNLEDASWYQPTPNTSLAFFETFKVPKNAKIIDVGGGDSLLVDHLLALGFNNISVLDISETAIQKAKKRLGHKASQVKWIVANVAEFVPTEKYDFWHDRATFHFLTYKNEVDKYIETINQNIEPNGRLVIGTFSENGPSKCSGIEIKQYSKKTLVQTVGQYFKKIKCFTENHTTPFATVQNFVFCSFLKKKFA
jgi:2-polyprenyl-3-methyl-5-hydroxy-6-metoxy-1,4-benzoquinol methylase